MKLAAIDIGTNSVHMVIVRVEQHRIFEIIDREKQMVKLGQGTLLTGRLPKENIERGVAALKAFKSIADAHNVNEIICTATSAVREARNGKEFIERVKRDTGIEIQLLSGTEEARMITLAVRHVIDLKDRRALIMDIGGGSMELIVADARHIYFAQSVKSGVIRLAERFIKHDPPRSKDIRKLSKWLQERLEPLSRRIQNLAPDVCIGTSGTILAFGELIRSGRKETKVKADKITLTELELMNEKLQSLDENGRLKLDGMDKKRVDQVIGGGILIETVMEKCRMNELILCDRALREGLIADYLIRFTPSEPAIVQARELRSKSVINLMHRWEIDHKHMEHTANLALQLFDALSEWHSLGSAEKELLEYATLLHDIGRVISYPQHHHHGWYIIRHSNLIGFQPPEIETIASIVAYHRRKNPKGKDPYLSHLRKKDAKTVKILSAILRVADGLDRQHNQVIKNIAAKREGPGHLSISLYSEEPAPLPMRAAIEKSGLLQKLLELKQIDFHVESSRSVARATAG